MDTMKIIKLLFQKMRQYDPKMLWMLAATHPFTCWRGHSGYAFWLH